MELVTVVVLLVLSLGLRLTGLQRFVANDEIRWTCRSIQFREALRRREWADTLRVGHPGVVTTWLGAAFIPRNVPEAELICRASEGGMELDKIGAAPEERTRRIAMLGQLLFQGRIGVSLFTWLSIFVVYLLVRTVWGPEIGLLSLGLIALDPFYLALSRVLHIDAVLTSLMTVSVLSLLASLRRPESSVCRSGLLLLSGSVGGLAMLQKSPALFVALFAALLLIGDAWRRGRSPQVWSRAGGELFLWALAAVIVYVALWPAMWSDPRGTIQRVLDTAVGYAGQGHEQGNYFLGRPVGDPGWGYYPVALLFRMSPLVLLGLIAVVFWIARGGELEERRFDVAALLVYSILFGVLMSLGAKKFDRYLLPVFPPIGIAAAVGLLEMAEAGKLVFKRIFNHSLRRWGHLTITVIVVVLQVALVLPHYPHYLTWYNPLLGGVRQARNAIVVGWGEGYEQAAAYLNAKSNAEKLRVAVPTFAAFAPLFSGETQPVSDFSTWQTDYVVFYLAQVQRQHDASLMERYFSNPRVQPEYTVVLHGVEYAWIYPNTDYLQPLKYIEKHSRPSQDLLLVNADSVLSRNYHGELEMREFRSHSSPKQVAELLDHLPSGCQRVWYPRYSNADPEIVVRLLQNSALRIEERDFPDVKVSLHRLLEERTASIPVDLRFGGLRLLGYGLTDPIPAWGRDGGVILEWESDQALEDDYTAFVHVYDSHGHRIAQGDSLIVDQYLRATSEWEPGSSGVTLHHLAIPTGTSPGGYDLRVGVYNLETGERLPLLDAQEEQQGTSALLEVEVGVSDRIPDPNDLAIAQSFERQVTPGLKLLGYDLRDRGVPAGEPILLTLFWQALDTPRQDYRLQLGLLDSEGASLDQRESGLVGADFATSQWRPGELVREHCSLPTDGEMTTGEVTLTLNLLDESEGPVLEQPLKVASVWVQSTEPTFDVPPGVNLLDEFKLGDSISLLGYELDPGEASAGDILAVTLYWRADTRITRSHKVFVHVYDQEGNIVGQRDRIPGLGIRPTTSWEPKEVIADRYNVEMSADLAPGTYLVGMGMYDADSGERIPAFGSDGKRLPQDRILLGELSIRR